MTRGKHASAALVRREASEQQAELATYQRKIKELLAELEKCKSARADSERLRKSQVANLKAQVDEGVSPALIVAQQESRKLREQRDHAQAQHKELLSKWQATHDRIVDHAQSAHGMTGLEAAEWLVSLISGEDMKITTAQRRLRSREAITAVQRARGERH